MKASVVICTFNRHRDCTETIQSMLDQTNSCPYEIIVVDDYSRKPFRFSHNKVEVIRNKRELGLGGSRNVGAIASSGDTVCFIDDDAVAAPDWIGRILGAVSKGADMVGGVAEPKYLAPPPKWWLHDIFGFFVGTNNRDIVGANFAVKRILFEKIGYFDESLGRKGGRSVSCEDIEYRERARAAGLDLVFDECIRVYHKVPPRRMTMSYLIHRSRGQGISKSVLDRLRVRSISPSVFPLSREAFQVFIGAARQKLALLPAILAIALILKVVFWFSVFYTSHFTRLK